jgi:hypothetical protein
MYCLGGLAGLLASRLGTQRHVTSIARSEKRPCIYLGVCHLYLIYKATTATARRPTASGTR